MLWLYLALAAYLINAVTFVIDKYLLATPVPKPIVYAFWVSILSASALFLIPFFPIFLTDSFYLLVSLSSGLSFFIGIIFLYKAIRKSDISIASTQVLTLVPIFTYIFAHFLLNESLPENAPLGLLFLIPGIALLGSKYAKGILKYSIPAGAFLGLSFALLKWTFLLSDLVNGIFWTRMGLVLGALAVLLFPKARKEIFASFKETNTSSKAVLVGNKTLGGVGFLMLYGAIELGSVTLVNALLGFQFLFIFLIAFLLRNKLPGIREHLEKETIIHKLAGIALIIIGFLIVIF